MKPEQNYMEGAGFFGNMKKKVEKTFKKNKNKNTTKQNFNPREAYGNLTKLQKTTKSNISKGNLRGSNIYYNATNIYYNATNITSRRADAYSKNEKEIIKREECKVEHNSLEKIIKNITNKNGIFRNGKELRPSKQLADSLVSLIKGNKEFVLIDTQKEVYETAISLAKESKNGKKNVIQKI